MEAPMKVLVVDDESPARQRLIRMLSEMQGDYEIAGEASDGIEAVELCRSKPVDVVLLDVQMPGMNGLEVAKEITQVQPPPAVILVTAYEQYALAAFEHQVEDYLVKPVRRERLQEALERVRVPTRPQRIALSNKEDLYPGRRHFLSAHYRGGLQTVPIENIIYLQAEHKYVTVRHTGGEILVDESLKSLEDEFPDLFVRIHRNALVSKSRLTGLSKTSDGGVEVRLRDCAEHLPVSRRHLADIRRWLRNGVG
jgi:two-component system, LytTR family, response regulator AlgR